MRLVGLVDLARRVSFLHVKHGFLSSYHVNAAENEELGASLPSRPANRHTVRSQLMHFVVVVL